MPKAAAKASNYRQDIAEVVSRVIGRMPNVEERRSGGGRPQFYAGSKLFAFVRRDSVAVKLPAELVQKACQKADYLPMKMRGKPVYKEWLEIKHPEAAAYAKDAPLFRHASRFVTAPPRPRA